MADGPSSPTPGPHTLAAAQVHDLIRKRDYDALKGCREGSELDFKEGWYRLEDDQQKAELAKTSQRWRMAAAGTSSVE
jgi:hypothetical protein